MGLLLACGTPAQAAYAENDHGASSPELKPARELEARGDFEGAIQAYAPLCQKANLVACHLGGLVATRQVADFDQAWKAAHCAMAFTPDMRPCVALHEQRTALETRAADGYVMLNRACEGGLAWACTDGGYMARQRTELGGADRQRLHFAAGCKGGDLRGCHVIAAMLVEGVGGAKDEKTALGIYRQICTQVAGQNGACLRYGEMVENGVGTPADPAAARAIFRTTCEPPGNDGESCLRLARQLRDGKGGPASHADAMRYFGMACEGGSKVRAACTEMAALQKAVR